MDIERCRSISERRKAEKAHLAHAIEGDSLADVHAANATLKESESEASEAKFFVIAQARRVFRRQLLTGIVNLHEDKVSANELADQVTALFDAWIEGDLTND